PAAAGSVVYVGGSSAVFALNASTGAVVWKAPAATAYSAPAVYNGYVYVSGGNGTLYVFKVGCATGGGSCNPGARAAGHAASPPSVASGRVYLGGSDGTLSALSAACLAGGGTSCVLWSSAPAGGPVTTTPAVAGARVFAGSNDGKVYAFPTSCATPCAA